MTNILQEENLAEILFLKDRDWKEFSVDVVFDEIKRGKRYVKSLQQKGPFPYISSKALNNGLDNFTVPTTANILHQNFIGINNSGSVGIAFFHPYKAVVSDHVTTLKNDVTNNAYISLFLSTVLESCNKGRYSFNYEMNNERLKRSKVILPVNQSEEIDYDFMIKYMKQIESSLDSQLFEEIQRDSVYEEIEEIEETKVDWSEFTIEEVFSNVASSPYAIDFNNLDNKWKAKREIPYVTRTSKNNGISNWISDMSDSGNNPIPGNCLTIGLDTATVNYQPSSFYTGQNIHLVRDPDLNKFTALFVMPLIEQSLKKFGWGGFSATLTRFKKTRILLPNKEGRPDWEYMEKYIKSLTYSKLI